MQLFKLSFCFRKINISLHLASDFVLRVISFTYNRKWKLSAGPLKVSLWETRKTQHWLFYSLSVLVAALGDDKSSLNS